MAEADYAYLFEEVQGSCSHEGEGNLHLNMDLGPEPDFSGRARVIPPGLQDDTEDGSEKTSMDYKLDSCAGRVLPAGPLAPLVEGKPYSVHSEVKLVDESGQGNNIRPRGLMAEPSNSSESAAGQPLCQPEQWPEQGTPLPTAIAGELLACTQDEQSAHGLQNGDVSTHKKPAGGNQQAAKTGKAKDQNQKKSKGKCAKKLGPVKSIIKDRVMKKLLKLKGLHDRRPFASDPYTTCLGPYRQFISEYDQKSDEEQRTVEIPMIPNW